MRHPTTFAALALAALLFAACVADPSGGSVTKPEPTSTPPLSSIPAATTRPAGPPKSPTDQSPEWIAGRVTRGGSGPCYGLETDDGTQYAMHDSDGITLEGGSIVRVRTEPLVLKIDCGPGTPVEILEVETVG